MPSRLPLIGLLCVALLTLGSAAGGAFIKEGDHFPGQALPDRAGERVPLYGQADVAVILFGKVGQEHSEMAVRALQELRKELDGRSVAWRLVVSEQTSSEALARLGPDLPVVLDTADELYGSCGIVMEPSAFVVDRQGKVLAFLAFRKVGFHPLLRAEILHSLGELSDAGLEAVRHPAAAGGSSDAAIAYRRAKLAQRLYEAGQFAKALESARISVERNPTLADHHLLLGRIFAALGRKPEAEAAFREALRLALDLAAARQELERLDAPAEAAAKDRPN